MIFDAVWEIKAALIDFGTDRTVVRGSAPSVFRREEARFSTRHPQDGVFLRPWPA